MFAHIVSGQAQVDGFDSVGRLAREQSPALRELPGFRGFYLLTDRHAGKLVTISLWDTAEQLQAAQVVAHRAGHATADEVAAGRAAPGAAVTGIRSDVYEVEESA